MKIEKMSLSNIKNMLSRAEMKKIMAGSSGACAGTATCGDGTIMSGIFVCNDNVFGADGDAVCGSHGSSTSCDCAYAHLKKSTLRGSTAS
jgi:hypothetical protein